MKSITRLNIRKLTNRSVLLLKKPAKPLITSGRYINMRATLRQARKAYQIEFNFRMVFNYGLDGDTA